MDVACFQDHLRWIDWNTYLDMEFNETNKLFDNFFTVMNDLLDTNAPYKKLSLRQIKLKKQWLTKGILTSIKAKNRLYRKFSRCKDKTIKKDLHSKFKNYRNRVRTIRESQGEKEKSGKIRELFPWSGEICVFQIDSGNFLISQNVVIL